jgi:hypothetical protein
MGNIQMQPKLGTNTISSTGLIYDPNQNSYIPVDRTNSPSIAMPFPTMMPTVIPANTDTSNFGSVNMCSTDQDCMHADPALSSPEKGLVYACPSAKCINKSCACGDCTLDPSTGICCKSLINIRGDSFCIDTAQMSALAKQKYMMKYGLKKH